MFATGNYTIVEVFLLKGICHSYYKPKDSIEKVRLLLLKHNAVREKSNCKVMIKFGFTVLTYLLFKEGYLEKSSEMNKTK